MDIIYTEYAENTISDRKINKEFIKDALLNPDELVDGKKNRKIAHKIVGNKLLRVVFEANIKAL